MITQAGVPLRGSVRVLDVVSQALQLGWHIPHWTTVRNWLLRTGLARWQHGLQPHEDWVFLIDHAVQSGTQKCLVSLGIRQSEYQQLDRPLTLADMTLLGLEVMPRSTKIEVHQALAELHKAVGDSVGVVHDKASDLSAGVGLLQKQKPEVQSIVDCKHKAACLLKKRLENDPRWKELQNRAGQSKKQLQQTPLAFLAPPSQRAKARYMNTDGLVVWGDRTLAVLEGKLDLPEEVKRNLEQAQEKLGWLRDYREDLNKYKGWLETMEVVVTHVGRHGLSADTAQKVEEELRKKGSLCDLGQELLAFVKEQSKGLKGQERMPGSTEVVETCMGKLKRLEGEQSKGGFTGLVLGLGAVIGKKDDRPAHQYLDQVSTKEVRAWIKSNLGVTVQAARRHLALAFRRSQQKPSPRSSRNLPLT